ncbi:hypothetical protein JOM56_008516 [Amanita muscaria]
MRLFSSIFWLLALLVTVSSAWDKDDYEIFDLVTAVEASEGKGTTFYSWLDVPSTASATEIVKAYRKLSVKLHPDKNPNTKGAHERFAKLGVVASILRNKESRERYDFFYKNGVPKWRGTGYYYSRFRPGLGTVSTFLITLTSILQYVIQGINYKNDHKRVQHIIQQARLAAWGPKLTPTAGQRKVKVNIGVLHGEDGFSEGSKFIDAIVDADNVYFLDVPSGQMHVIDGSIAVKPTVVNTWFIKLVGSAFRKVVPKRSQDLKAPATEVQDKELTDASDSSNKNEGGKSQKQQPAVKAEKKRRKAAKK